MSAGWFHTKPFATRLIIVATVCDITGAALGYAFHPQLGVDPILGIVYGLIAATIPLGLWLTMQPEVRS